MSDSTSSTDPNALLFPAFLYGAHGTCRRKMKAEAKKWAMRYQERGDFPEVKCIPVPAGSIMYCDRSSFEMLAMGFQYHTAPAATLVTQRPPLTELEVGSPIERHSARWYFYLVDELRSDTGLTLAFAWQDSPEFQAAHEAFLCRYPWGALSLNGPTMAITADAQPPHAFFDKKGDRPATMRFERRFKLFGDVMDTVQNLPHDARVVHKNHSLQPPPHRSKIPTRASLLFLLKPSHPLVYHDPP